MAIGTGSVRCGCMCGTVERLKWMVQVELMQKAPRRLLRSSSRSCDTKGQGCLMSTKYRNEMSVEILSGTKAVPGERPPGLERNIFHITTAGVSTWMPKSLEAHSQPSGYITSRSEYSSVVAYIRSGSLQTPSCSEFRHSSKLVRAGQQLAVFGSCEMFMHCCEGAWPCVGDDPLTAARK